MVRQKSKRHLSFEQLDGRIAMNSDSYPLRLIGFELPQRSYGANIEVRSILVSTGEAAAIQQVANARSLTKYEFILLSLRPAGKLIGEGEGKGGTDHTIHTQPPRGPGNSLAEGELRGKPSAAVRGAEQPGLSAASVFSATQPSSSAAVKQPLQQSAASAGQNQNGSRPETSLPKPLSLQAQSSTLVASSAAQTAIASPLLDNLSSKRDFNSVSVASQGTFLQSKSTLNELASVSSNAKGPTQTGVVLGPKTELAKPTKDGMLSLAMDGSLRSESELPNGTPSKASRLRTQQQSEVLWRQMQRAQVDSAIDALAVNAKRLPVPKGMIEICDQAENLQRQGVVAKASANPFEILQLFIGSTNMVQSQSESDAQAPSPIGIGLDSQESTEVATKEDILATLGIGAVLAITIRQSRVRLRTNPLLATVRRPVAQAT